MLIPLAIAAGAATLVDAATSFSLSQVLGVAAQRAIADMRMSMQRHITRLPTSYFDSTQTGVLISRVMNDADGIRNLVGSGLVQLVGGLVTATIALGVLFYLNWRLTLISIMVLAVFAAGMIVAFRRLRPLFRERGKITAEVSGRLGESFGGIRIVKAYIAEEREDRVFSTGVQGLFENVRTTLTGISAVTSFGGVVIGAIGVVMMVGGGRAILAGTMTLGDFVMYIFFVGHARRAADPDVVDRHAAVRGARGTRSHPRNQGDGHRGRGGRDTRTAGAVRGDVAFETSRSSTTPTCQC